MREVNERSKDGSEDLLTVILAKTWRESLV